MANNLNYAIVLRLVTEGLRKGSATVVGEVRKMQMGMMSFVAAMGAGTIGLSNLLSRMRPMPTTRSSSCGWPRPTAWR